MMPIRLSKILIVFAIGMYMLFVVFNNITDYNANFQFVTHVMSMSDTYAGSMQDWRGINNTSIHHFCYWVIILTEGVIMFLCMLGAYQMFKERNRAKKKFDLAKKYAVYGLTLGISLWFLGFIAVGGEWFMMWQSEAWNGNPTAFSNSIFFTLSLLHLTNQND